jgi:hypothetical protein
MSNNSAVSSALTNELAVDGNTMVSSSDQDMDESGSLDAKLDQICALAKQLGLPNLSIICDESLTSLNIHHNPKEHTSTSLVLQPGPWAANNGAVEANMASPTASLLGLPIELRDTIYGMLLRNPILGTKQAVTSNTLFGAETKHGLHPEILRVCKKTNLEGKNILYNKQTFYLACLDVTRDHYSPHRGFYYTAVCYISPLTRYYHSEYTRHSGGTLTHIPSLSSVSRWKIVVEIPRHNSTCNWGFTGLCFSPALRSLCNVLCKASLDFLNRRSRCK